MADSETRTADIQKLADLIKDITFAMLTTVDIDGSLRSRPMATLDVEFDGNLWFFTNADAPKVDEAEHDHHVNVSYANPDRQRYVSVSGMATLVRDQSKNRALWNPAYTAWFPQGLDEPNLALLRVSVQKAEYWESPSGAVVHLADFA